MNPKTRTRVLQEAEGKDVVILGCTVFDWFTSVTDRWTDTNAMAKTRSVHAVVRKNPTKSHLCARKVTLYTGACSNPQIWSAWCKSVFTDSNIYAFSSSLHKN